KYKERPITSQISSRTQVSQGRNTIISSDTSAPIMGTNGTHGVLNGRGMSGLRRRMSHTPMQTITNASIVPMLTSSPRIEMGMVAANSPTKMPTKMDEM